MKNSDCAGAGARLRAEIEGTLPKLLSLGGLGAREKLLAQTISPLLRSRLASFSDAQLEQGIMQAYHELGQLLTKVGLVKAMGGR